MPTYRPPFRIDTGSGSIVDADGQPMTKADLREAAERAGARRLTR